IFEFKEDRQITHNSMFADYYHRRTPQKKSTTKLSKIRTSPSTKKTRPSPMCDQDRLVSSQEKNTSPSQEPVRFRGILKIIASGRSSTGIFAHSRFYRTPHLIASLTEPGLSSLNERTPCRRLRRPFDYVLDIE